jgi:hypothetical protein
MKTLASVAISLNPRFPLVCLTNLAAFLCQLLVPKHVNPELRAGTLEPQPVANRLIQLAVARASSLRAVPEP